MTDSYIIVSFEAESGGSFVINDEFLEMLLGVFSNLSRERIGWALECIDELSDDMLDFVFILAFYARDIKEGLGQRDVFYILFKHLWKICPEKCLSVARLIPEYGGWFDMYRMFPGGSAIDGLMQRTHALHVPDIRYEDLIKAFVDVYVDRIIRDYYTVITSEDDISLAGKWAPREGTHYHWFAKYIASNETFQKIFPDMRPFSRYRKVVSALNRRIRPIETYMCEDQSGSSHFADIDFEKVPRKALSKYRNALMNTQNQDRIECAQRFEEYTKTHEDYAITFRKTGKSMERLKSVIKSDRYRPVFLALGF